MFIDQTSELLSVDDSVRYNIQLVFHSLIKCLDEYDACFIKINTIPKILLFDNNCSNSYFNFLKFIHNTEEYLEFYFANTDEDEEYNEFLFISLSVLYYFLHEYENGNHFIIWDNEFENGEIKISDKESYKSILYNQDIVLKNDQFFSVGVVDLPFSYH